MEKITKSHSVNVPPVKLFLDDIEKIVDAFQELSTKINIETDEYSLENVNELTKLHCDTLKELHIKSFEPFLSLDLQPSSIYLYTINETLASRGTFEKIKELLNSKRRKFATLLEKWWPLQLLGAILGFAIGITLSAMMKSERWHFIVSVALITGWFLGMLGTYYNVRYRNHALIILKRRVDQPSFLKRNKDHIIVGIIIAFVSGAIGWALRTLIK